MERTLDEVIVFLGKRGRDWLYLERSVSRWQEYLFLNRN